MTEFLKLRTYVYATIRDARPSQPSSSASRPPAMSARNCSRAVQFSVKRARQRFRNPPDRRAEFSTCRTIGLLELCRLSRLLRAVRRGYRTRSRDRSRRGLTTRALRVPQIVFFEPRARDRWRIAAPHPALPACASSEEAHSRRAIAPGRLRHPPLWSIQSFLHVPDHQILPGIPIPWPSSTPRSPSLPRSSLHRPRSTAPGDGPRAESNLT